jgi:hypothetical protein
MDPTPLHPKVMTKLPDMAVYGPGVAGNVRRKTTVKVQPLQGTSYNPTGQRVIQIQLPKNGFLNGLNSYFVFSHKTPGNGLTLTDYPNLQEPAQIGASNTSQEICEASGLSTSGSNWIQRLRIKIGGKIVEDIDDYNVLHEILKSSVVTSQYRDSLAGQLEGYEPSWSPKVVEVFSPALNGTVANIQLAGKVQGSIDGVFVNKNRSGRLNFGAFNEQESVANGFDPDEAKYTLQYWGKEGREYQVVLLSGLLRSAKYLPLRFMPPVEIEVTLADFVRCHTWAPSRDNTSLETMYANTTTTTVAGTPGTLPADAGSLTLPVDIASAGALANSFIYLTQPAGNISQPLMLQDAPTQFPNAVANKPSAELPSAKRTYEINNVAFMAEILEFDDSFYQAFEASLSQGITIPYITYTNHVYSHTGGTTDIQIAERVRSARSILAVMRRNGDLSHPPYPKFIFSRNGLEGFQVKIGTQYFPMHTIDTKPSTDLYAGERLIELQKVISAMADVSHGMSVNAFDHKTKFILGMDLQREFDRLSGLDTTKGLPLFIRLEHNSSEFRNCQLNVFVSYDMFVDLFPGEVVEVLN